MSAAMREDDARPASTRTTPSIVEGGGGRWRLSVKVPPDFLLTKTHNPGPEIAQSHFLLTGYAAIESGGAQLKKKPKPGGFPRQRY